MTKSLHLGFAVEIFAFLSIIFSHVELRGGTEANDSGLSFGLADTIYEYTKKICETEWTCNATKNAPKVFLNMRIQNCMCDQNCVEYDDCCEDSLYRYRNSSFVEIRPFECVKTALDGEVFMVTSCPSSWNESLSIVKNCALETDNLNIVDPLLLTPVTSTSDLVTYRNLFCAACHNESDFTFWNVLVLYEKVEELDVTGNATNEIESSEVLVNASIILNSMEFDKNSSSWQFYINDALKSLHVYGISPRDLSQELRRCVSRKIDSCPANWSDAQIRTKCADYTSYVYVNEEVFKNKYCAECHNLTADHIRSCGHETKRNFVFKNVDRFTVNIDDDLLEPLKESCNDLPDEFESELSSTHGLVCRVQSPVEKAQSTPKASTISSCFPKNLRYHPPKRCLVYKATNKSDEDIIIENNSSLIFLGTRYFNDKDAFWNDRSERVTVCGTYITPSSPLLYKIEEVLTTVLINVSIVCLIFQLLFFQQLRELRNLSGKNLACFSFTLLIFYICYNFGPAIRTLFGSCFVTAILSHYCLLSCFVWMFVMSYDCWLSLYRATSQFRTSGGKHATKFAIYCVISWCTPLFVIGYSLYLEFFMVKTFETCGKLPVPGYGLTPSCWILGNDAKLYLHFIPSSAMILGNVCFFTHTVCMVYGSKRNSVNPNTQNDFQIYARLALLMGLTWTLGILNNLTDGDFSDVVGVVYDLMNMSQGALIFFGFTCKEKTLKLLLNKHKENRFLKNYLVAFLPRDTKDLNMTEMKTNSTDTSI